MGTAVGVGVSIAIDVGMGVAVGVNMDVGGILATFVSAWLLGVGLDCIVPTPGAVAVGSGVAVGVGSGVFVAPKPKPRWDVHLQYIGDWAGILAEILRPLIAGRCGSGP